MTAQHLAIQHARQNDVVGEFSLSDALRPRIDFAERLSDDVQVVRRFPFVTHLPDPS
jgi:hypothetical protein